MLSIVVGVYDRHPNICKGESYFEKKISDNADLPCASSQRLSGESSEK